MFRYESQLENQIINLIVAAGIPRECVKQQAEFSRFAYAFTAKTGNGVPGRGRPDILVDDIPGTCATLIIEVKLHAERHGRLANNQYPEIGFEQRNAPEYAEDGVVHYMMDLRRKVGRDIFGLAISWVNGKGFVITGFQSFGGGQITRTDALNCEPAMTRVFEALDTLRNMANDNRNSTAGHTSTMCFNNLGRSGATLAAEAVVRNYHAEHIPQIRAVSVDNAAMPDLARVLSGTLAVDIASPYMSVIEMSSGNDRYSTAHSWLAQMHFVQCEVGAHSVVDFSRNTLALATDAKGLYYYDSAMAETDHAINVVATAVRQPDSLFDALHVLDVVRDALPETAAKGLVKFFCVLNEGYGDFTLGDTAIFPSDVEFIMMPRCPCKYFTYARGLGFGLDRIERELGLRLRGDESTSVADYRQWYDKVLVAMDPLLPRTLVKSSLSLVA